ncbi:MAG: hypothetical protein RIR41_108 [Pseudomonadota bacterium]|jgi:hypothetical protein
MKRVLVALVVLSACTPATEPVPQPVASAPPEVAIEPTLMADEIPAPNGEITVTGVKAEARVTSPLVVEGLVKSDWIFEGQFPAKIEVDGKPISEAPARYELPQDGSYPETMKFRAELPFDVAAETPATLVLQEDMPAPLSAGSDVAGPARTLRIPIVLVPPAQ